MKQVARGVLETNKIAESFIENVIKKQQSLSSALVVGLFGDLGAGKTAFTKAVAMGLGIKGKISSPTFVIMKKYPINVGQYKFLVHIDAYRLKHEKELLYLGWNEMIKNPQNIVFIEWPENVLKIMPKNSKSIYISHTSDGHREFKFQ